MDGREKLLPGKENRICEDSEGRNSPVLEGRKPKVTRGGGVGEAGRCWVVEELVFGRKHGLGFFFPFNCFLINCLTVWAAEQCHRNSHEVWSLEV